MPYRRKQAGRGLTKKQRVEVKKLVIAPMEKKRWPVYLQGVALTATHFVSDLTAIQQGDTEEARDGDQIMVQSINIKGHVVASDETNVIRLTLIRWKPNSVPTSADIYDDDVIGIRGAMFSPFNHTTRQNFAVLQDKFLTVEASTYGTAQRMFNLRVKRQPKTVFNGTATTGQGKLYLVMQSDSTTINHPSITFRGDVLYTDC